MALAASATLVVPLGHRGLNGVDGVPNFRIFTQAALQDFVDFIPHPLIGLRGTAFRETSRRVDLIAERADLGPYLINYRRLPATSTSSQWAASPPVVSVIDAAPPRNHAAPARRLAPGRHRLC